VREHFRGLGPLTRAYLLQSFRSGTAIFWNLVFPMVWLFLFGFVFYRGQPSLMMPGLLTITLISGAFFGVSYLMVSEREAGILRRYRVTPVTATTVVLANAIRALVMLSISVSAQAGVGWLVFRYEVTGSLLLAFLVMLLGAAAFIPLGMFVGSVAQDMRTAPAISNLLFFPLVFGSGAAFPAFMLPGWLQSVMRMIPSSYLVEALQGVMLRGHGLLDLAGPISVLLLTLVIGAWLNSKLFRWESSQPLNKRAMLTAIAVLTLLYVAAALLAPAFEMIRPPGAA
jgi:ABC-2 type transport system permease protein